MAGNNTSTVYANSSNIPIDVLANDQYVPDLTVSEALTVVSLTQPAHGTARLVYGQVLYTPNAGYVGSDTFGYTISDGAGGTAAATVNVTVQNPPGERLKVWLEAQPVADGNDYPVQVWGEIVNGVQGESISDLSVTVYAQGMANQTDFTRRTIFGPTITGNGFMTISPTMTGYDGDGNEDAVGMVLGTTTPVTGLGLQPVLLATQTWMLNSGTPCLAVAVSSASRYFDASGDRETFGTVEGQGSLVPLWALGDVNQDGVVNAADINAVYARHRRPGHQPVEGHQRRPAGEPGRRDLSGAKRPQDQLRRRQPGLQGRFRRFPDAALRLDGPLRLGRRRFQRQRGRRFRGLPDPAG